MSFRCWLPPHGLASVEECFLVCLTTDLGPGWAHTYSEGLYLCLGIGERLVRTCSFRGASRIKGNI